LSRPIILALDAMGGDNAPGMVLKGANIARERHPSVRFLLFGNEAVIAPILAGLPKLRDCSEIRHTEEFIPGEMKPSLALRQSKRSSMRLAIEAAKNAEAQAVVSAGNTGALMALSKIIFGTMPGVDRPAIASYLPTQRGETVMLDLGANVSADAATLVQYAILGEVFSRTVMGVPKPSVALLNVGSEDQKGHEEVREAAQRIRSSGLPIDFQGFVEGNDITDGTVDVVVTDGFTGNIALKTAEGTAKMYAAYLKRALKSSIWSRLGYLLARKSFVQLREKLDPRQYNGAVLLGLQGIAVKSHGGTDAFGFANAIGVAVDMVQHGFTQAVEQELAAFSTVGAHAANGTV
jgi:phosphate acyltransferase